MRRAAELAITAAALVILAPVLAALALLVRLQSRQAFFTQQRAGLHGQAFTIYKLRSMSDARDANGALLPDGSRLTRLGRWLRATSLDELPELWNVLRGDMSLVGPRPLPVAYLPRYTPEEARRHAVRPGLTGWAQVNGRNSVGWDERLAMDVWYVDHRSLGLDATILMRSVGAVLRRDGVSGDGTETMQELRPHLAAGNPDEGS